MTKQIEEMANIIDRAADEGCAECKYEQTICGVCGVNKVAKALYNAGYRKQVEGEWICKWKSTFPQYEPDEYCCSNCGCVENSRRNFCPDCGAQMKGENQ